jgi:hypothetical protein
MMAIFVTLLAFSRGAAAVEARVEEGSDDRSAPSDACRGPQAELARYQDVYGHGALTFRHLIAVIPDPQDSAHAAYFDSVLEGVEEAVGSGTIRDDDEGTPETSYVRDRSWLPWPGNDPDKGKLKCWRERPGLLIFRPSIGTDKAPTLLLLLVGESPTWGVQVEQFDAAVDLIEKYDATYPAALDYERYKILGPTFSGSAASLGSVIASKLPPSASVRVASGTATHERVADWLSGESGARSGSARVSYASAVPTDRELESAMLCYLLERGGSCSADGRNGNIVMLAESLTAYGTSWQETSERTPPSRAGGVCERALSNDFESCVEHRKFPANLASIRLAYGALSDDSAQTRAPADARQARREKTSEMSDETAIEHDLALAEVLHELSREHTRFVGIAATDARDVIFLAQRIRKQLPDVRLFTYGFDIRYLHPAFAKSAMNGVLVAHAAPPSDLEHPSTSLENEMVRSVFLASQHLLTGRPLAPQTRVSLIGNGSLWHMEQQSLETPEARAAALTPPLAWDVVFWLSWVVLAASTIVLLAPWLADRTWIRGLAPPLSRRGFRTAGFLRHRGPAWSLFGRCEHADLQAEDACVSAALYSVVATVPAFMGFVLEEPTELWNPPKLPCFIVALSVAVAWGIALSRRRRPGWGPLLIALGTSVTSLSVLALSGVPLHEANLNLLSGGSAVMVVLAGLAIVALSLWCWRVRLRALDLQRFGVYAAGDRFVNMAPPIAEALAEGPGGSGLFETEQHLLRIVRSPWLNFIAVPATVHAALILTIAVPFAVRSPQTFEPGARNWLLIGFGCLALLPISANFSRVITTFVALRRVLRRVADPELLAAFGRLPPELARKLERQIAVSGSNIIELGHAVRCLEKLGRKQSELTKTSETVMRQFEGELRYEAGYAGSADGDRNTSRRALIVTTLFEAAREMRRLRTGASTELRQQFDDFHAALLAVFVARYVRYLRLFLPPLLIGSLLCVLMTSLYFIQPHQLISSLIFVWVAVEAITVLLVYTALDRDPVISAIGKTTAGSVDLSWGFVSRLVTWGLVPVATLLAAQYPEFAFWVSSISDTFLKGFR